MTRSEFNVRGARVEDAEALVKLHYDAVHTSAKGDYPPAVLDSWSPQPDQCRYSRMRSQIEDSGRDVLVAEAAGGAVAGFCMFAPSEGFIHAVYVAPGSARRGVGRTLLRCAEAGIAERGLTRARLNASRNALEFYRAEGYEVVEATTQALADGSRMECHAMGKNLPVATRRWGLVKPALIYFALVFGVGFLLGPIRVLWLEPRVGVRAAELVESPFMLIAILLAGRWVGRRLCAGYSRKALLAVGMIAAALVLAADLAVGVGLRGMSVTQVFTGRDPVSGTLYYALVVLLGVMPWLSGRCGSRRPLIA